MSRLHRLSKRASKIENDYLDLRELFPKSLFMYSWTATHPIWAISRYDNDTIYVKGDDSYISIGRNFMPGEKRYIVIISSSFLDLNAYEKLSPNELIAKKEDIYNIIHNLSIKLEKTQLETDQNQVLGMPLSDIKKKLTGSVYNKRDNLEEGVVHTFEKTIYQDDEYPLKLSLLINVAEVAPKYVVSLFLNMQYKTKTVENVAVYSDEEVRKQIDKSAKYFNMTYDELKDLPDDRHWPW